MTLLTTLPIICDPLVVLLLSVASLLGASPRPPTSTAPRTCDRGMSPTGMRGFASTRMRNPAAEPAPPPRPVIVGVHMTHIGFRRVAVGSLLVTDRLQPDALKPHVAGYQHPDKSDEFVFVQGVDQYYLRAIGQFLAPLQRETKVSETAVVRVVLIWGKTHQEYYLDTKEAKNLYKLAIQLTKDEDLAKVIRAHIDLFDR